MNKINLLTRHSQTLSQIKYEINILIGDISNYSLQEIGQYIYSLNNIKTLRIDELS